MAASSPSYHGSRALDADAYERQLEEKVAEIARAFAPFVDASRARKSSSSARGYGFKSFATLTARRATRCGTEARRR